MRKAMKGAVFGAAVLLLAACSDQGGQHAAIRGMEFSQLDWSEMTAAPTAAHVTNNNLIMMR